MKKSQLRQLIREEIENQISDDNYKLDFSLHKIGDIIVFSKDEAQDGVPEGKVKIVNIGNFGGDYVYEVKDSQGNISIVNIDYVHKQKYGV